MVTDVSLENNTRTNRIWVVSVGAGAPVSFECEPVAADSPRWSPDGRQVAFVSARDGSSQIWIGEVSSSGQIVGEPRKLTSLTTEAGGPKWSPDGRWIAFTSDVYPECGTIACNEAKLEEQASAKSRARVFDHLLFRHWVSWKDGRHSHVLLVPSDGSAPPRDLTPGAADVPPFSLGGPDDYAFSPDSCELAFARKTDPVEAISTTSDLFLLDLTAPGAAARKITSNTA